MKLTFNSATADFADDFPEDQELGRIKVAVMDRMKLDPGEAPQYIIACDGKTLDESQTVAQLGLPEDAMLILWRTGAATSGTRTWDRSKE